MLDESARWHGSYVGGQLCEAFLTCSLELTLLDFGAQPVGQVLASRGCFCIRTWLELKRQRPSCRFVSTAARLRPNDRRLLILCIHLHNVISQRP